MQFKVHRDGFWSKVDYQKDESEHDQREEVNVPFSSPWIQRYRNSKIQATKRCPSSSAKAPLATTHTSNLSPSRENGNGDNIGIFYPILDIFLCTTTSHYHHICSRKTFEDFLNMLISFLTEMSDQNFNDVAVTEEPSAKIDEYEDSEKQ